MAQQRGKQGEETAALTARQRAMRFVVLLGVVSLFADMTYEAGRSITGPFLAELGAGAAAVGVVAGLGELFGYSLRGVFGYLSDRTRRYWFMTILGYAVNLGAVPLLALAGSWPVAAGLIVAERLGKAVRTPARDAMLSHATRQLGHGWGFGLHEALDQVGAITGPLIVAAAFALTASYRRSFAVLAGPAVLAFAVLGWARLSVPDTRALEEAAGPPERSELSSLFRPYVVAASLMAFGFADFALLAYHVKQLPSIGDQWIPLLYAGAMGVDALAALALGWWFDRRGIIVLAGAAALSTLFAPLAFSADPRLVVAGLVLWSIGLGSQESILRAVVARLTPEAQRATIYGIFNTCFGLSWFAGSALMGLLYDRSLPGLIVLSMAAQGLAAVIVWRIAARWQP